jgi:hypothetical protein
LFFSASKTFNRVAGWTGIILFWQIRRRVVRAHCTDLFVKILRGDEIGVENLHARYTKDFRTIRLGAYGKHCERQEEEEKTDPSLRPAWQI